MALVLLEGAASRSFEAAAFPLALGLASDGTLAVGADAEGAPLLWLVAHPRGLSLQPERGRTPVIYNGAPVRESVWLQDGAEIAIGAVSLIAAVDGDAITLRVERAVIEQERGQARRFGATSARASDAGRRKLRTATRAALAFFGVLLLAAAYVVIASPVQLRIAPAPDNVTWSGFPPPVAIGVRYLVFPGDYVVEATKEGFVPTRLTVSVPYGESPVVEFALRKLPGRLEIATPPITGATILIDGTERGASPLNVEAEAGEREIRVTSERYVADPVRLEVRGGGEVQALEIAMRPAWGTLGVTSNPDKAMVRVGDKELGETPLQAELLQGEHEIEISKPGWKPARRTVAMQAGAALTVPTVELERIDGTVELASTPTGAAVTLDGQFRGHTPLSLALIGERPYRLEVSKAGYEPHSRSLQVEGGKAARVNIELAAELGTVFLTVSPPGSTVLVNGRPSGSGSQRLSLQTVPQTIEVTRPGYEPFKTSITPQRGLPKRVDVTLKTVGDALNERAAKGVFTPGGQKLALVHIPAPVRFTMGAPRREAGRRSNEVEYPVQLSRSYFISEKEVTNAEFRKFRSTHSSGAHQGNSLDGADQPVVNVSWEDAARYANWLSRQEGLAPAYKEEGGRAVPVVPLNGGYRLPTEAEWEFAARTDGGRSVSKPRPFPWGDAMPPPANSGNYANEGSRLPFAMPGYADAFPASAPVGKFAAGAAMIYDLGGNVAEWCHDFYDVPVASDQPKVDPAGPAQGRFHVVKGSSWRSGTITELRFSYRDYAETARDDLGFRVVRYVDAPR